MITEKRRKNLMSHMIRCFYFLITISTFFFTISCQNQVEFNAPIRDWFDEYANSAAIEDFKIESEFVKDKTGAVCIPSDGDKTVTLLLRNPRNYSLNMNFMTVLHDEISCEQNSSDKNIASITYSQTYLTMHDGGDPIGGNITVSESETGRPFLAFEYSLKCNTPPPSVMGQAVLVSSSLGQKCVVCFYLPTSELSSDTHKNDTHTIFIDNQQVASGTVSELEDASAPRPSDLTLLSSGASFSNTAPSGYTPFYYVTDRVMHENDNLSWDIWLEDDDGLKSRTMKASTIVREAHMSVSGGTNEAVITTQESDNTTIITAAVDEGTVEEWKWESSETGIASVVKDLNDNSIATVTGVSGGQTVINITAKLADGRIVTAAKNVRVLSLEFKSTCPTDFIKGQSGIQLLTETKGFPATPSISWTSSHNLVATAPGGSVTAVAKGTATVSISTSYSGKTVSATKEIYVHEVTISGGTEAFKGGSNIALTANISSPQERNAPSNIEYSWSSGNESVASVGTSSGVVTPVAQGSAQIQLKTKLNNKQITADTKIVNIYDVAMAVSAPTSKDTNNGDSTWSDSNTCYALTSLTDNFNLCVTNSTSFPQNTSFSWTVTDADNHSTTKVGASATVYPNEVGTIGTNPTNKTRWNVSCTATLPSGLISPVKAQSFYVYKLTIPSVSIVLDSRPTELLLNGADNYYIGSGDYDKQFTFSIDAEGYMPQGVTYSWAAVINNGQNRSLGTGNYPSITKSINLIRGTTDELTQDVTCQINCTLSLTGCDPRFDSTSFTFKVPLTINDNQITKNNSIDGAYVESIDTQYNCFEFGPSDLNINWYFSVNQMTGCEYAWAYSFHSFSTFSSNNYSVTYTTNELCSNTSSYAHVGNDLYCKIRRPGYKDKVVTFRVEFVFNPIKP